MKTSYTGRTIAGLPEVRVHKTNKNNVILDPGPSHKVAYHSPTGFAWSYGGSGPAQLALAILLDYTGDPKLAEKHHQQFKWDFVASWGENWHLPGERIDEWLLRQR